MGGNHTHRTDWFSLYPFPDVVRDAYIGKGDTVNGDGAWIGMRPMIMPGVTIGEGRAVVASGAIVTKNVAPHTIVAGNPARPFANGLLRRQCRSFSSLTYANGQTPSSKP